MRRVNLLSCLLLGLCAAACESPKPRQDPDLPSDDAAVGAVDARAGDDAAPDASPGRADAAPDAGLAPGRRRAAA
ncbi:MAG: hypothetical protein H6704_22660 [Myxococcales bacterium]|nr:hypothetical protein [Myxococcales bacterium]